MDSQAENNRAMSPNHKKSEACLSKLHSAQYCVTMIQYIKYAWNPSYSSRDSMWKHSFDQNMTFQKAGVTLKRSPTSNQLFPLPIIYLCKFGQNPPKGFKEYSVGRVDFYSLYRMVTLKFNVTKF